MTGQITWGENHETGEGELTLLWDNGCVETAEWDCPITAASDSHDIANQFFSDFREVTHDRETVFVCTC